MLADNLDFRFATPTDVAEVIEFINDGAAKRSFKLVSWYQVFRARMSHDILHPARAEFADRLYDVALMQAYVNSAAATGEATGLCRLSPCAPSLGVGPCSYVG